MTLTQHTRVFSPPAQSIRPAAILTTDELAARFSVSPQTPRASFCRFGHWMGLVPVKLPNGRLLWSADQADALIAGETAKTPDPADLDKHFARKAADADKVRPHIRAKIEAKAKRLTTGEG
ncbi:MAG: hypothetical protein V5B34_19105 [Accumulibacter sp.]|jgi:hypothetical protein